MDEDAVKCASLPQLIAYLSLCMLAAGFGAMVGPVWSREWMIFGTFGLASAVGLDALGRSRARLAKNRRSTQLTLKAQRKLDAMMGEMDSFAAIGAALDQLRPGAADSKFQGIDCQAEPRLHLKGSATIRPLVPSPGGAGYRPGEPRTVRVRNISRHGVGLAHDQRLERGFALLEIDLANGEPLEFIADVLWCELQNSGCHFSGAKILEVVNPGDVQPARSP